MRFDRFTIKAQEALQTAQSLASDAQSPELGVEHLMLALIGQTDGIVPTDFPEIRCRYAGNHVICGKPLLKRHPRCKARQLKYVLHLPCNPY